MKKKNIADKKIINKNLKMKNIINKEDEEEKPN